MPVLGGNLSVEQTPASGRRVTTMSTHPPCRVMYVARVLSELGRTDFIRDDLIHSPVMQATQLFHV